MSDLQIGLLILGLFVIGGVVAFNWYQEKRFRQRADQGFNRPDADVLLSANGGQPEEADAPEERIDPRLDPQLEASPVEEENDEPVPEISPVAAKAQPLSDESISYVAEIRAGEVVPAKAIEALEQALKETGRKFQLFGYDYHKRKWEPVSDQEHWFTSIRLAVQLVDRGGAIGQEELEEIAALVRRHANAISGICEAPDIDEVMARTIALDDFCVEVDVIVGLSVAARPGQVLHGTQLRALAEANGMKLGLSGVFVLPDAHGGALFSMDNQESNPFSAQALKTLTTRGVTFLLDVPRTPNGVKVFNKMVSVSKQFADSLDAVLCDDNRVLLNDSGLEKIRNQLRSIYEKMEKRGIPAGGATARQLFS